METELRSTEMFRFKVDFYRQRIQPINVSKNLTANVKNVEPVNTERGAGKALFYSGEDNFKHMTRNNKVVVNSTSYINDPAIEIFDMKKNIKKKNGKTELEEELETSIIFPSYFNPRLKNKLVNAWRNIVSGQAFTGSWLELSALKWSTRNGPISELRDCNRRTVQNTGSGVFKALCTPSQVLSGKNIVKNSILYLKSRFVLSRVNDDKTAISGGKTWKGLESIAKGTTWGEPDVILREIKEDGSIILSIFEFKIGYGKSSDSGAKATEWNQLTRVKRNLELLINEWISENGGLAEVRKKYPKWKRPVIKLYFVGWAAPNESSVELVKPTNYVPPSGYEVQPLNGTSFGTLTGMNANFINKLVEELNYARAFALSKAIEEIQRDPEYISARANYERNMMRQLAQARQLPMKPVSEVSSVREGNKKKTVAKAANASGAGQVAGQVESLVNLLRRRGAANANFMVQSALTNPNKFPALYKQFLETFVAPGNAPTNTAIGRMRLAVRKAREGRSPGNKNLAALNMFNSYLSTVGVRGGKKK